MDPGIHRAAGRRTCDGSGNPSCRDYLCVLGGASARRGSSARTARSKGGLGHRPLKTWMNCRIHLPSRLAALRLGATSRLAKRISWLRDGAATMTSSERDAVGEAAITERARVVPVALSTASVFPERTADAFEMAAR